MARRIAFICKSKEKLSPKAIERPPLPLESVHHIHGSDSLPLGVLRVGDGVLDGIFQEDLENTVFPENVIGDTLFADTGK